MHYRYTKEATRQTISRHPVGKKTKFTNNEKQVPAPQANEVQAAVLVQPQTSSRRQSNRLRNH